MEPKILVIGATGYVGQRLLQRFLDKNIMIRCIARTPGKLYDRFGDKIQIIKGDVLKPETLQQAFEGIETVYYLVHSMGTGKKFADIDNRAALNVAAFAKKNNVKRIIYLGGLAHESENLSSHLSSRLLVGKKLQSTGVPVTEFRASIIIGSGSASFEIIRDLVRKLPVMVTPRWVKSRCQPIAIDDVLYYLTESLDQPETTGKTLEIGGETVLSYGEMMKRVAALMNKRLLMIPVPVLTPRLSAYWLNIVTTVPMNIAKPLVDGLKNDSICQEFRIRSLMPHNCLSFDRAVKDALYSDEKKEWESRWSAASGSSIPSLPVDGSGAPLEDRQEITSSLTQEQLYDRIIRLGGDTGWYYANSMWKLRGGIDRLLGGVGMRRGRPHPSNLITGDPVDFWRVDEIRKGELLRLYAEMKLPGKAFLQFRIRPQNSHSVLEQSALFWPKSLLGYLYWYALAPIHFFIFRNMAKRIAKL